MMITRRSLMRLVLGVGIIMTGIALDAKEWLSAAGFALLTATGLLSWADTIGPDWADGE